MVCGGCGDCGQAVCAIDYATAICDLRHGIWKKPIKNRELSGSGDTCIRGARQAALGNGWCGMAR
jgi:hypothetical protein